MQAIAEGRAAVRGVMLVAVATAVVACGGKTEAGGGSAQAGGGAPPPGAAPSPAASANAPSTGVVDTVAMITDGTGNYFKPKALTAHQGDVIRFTLTTGVHNVDFLPDSNPGKAGLPPASALLQLPGQTFDVPVTFAPGTYYFQCDPHAALGMRGHLVVK